MTETELMPNAVGGNTELGGGKFGFDPPGTSCSSIQLSYGRVEGELYRLSGVADSLMKRSYTPPNPVY